MSIASPKGTCVECRQHVKRSQSAVYEVHGYERERGQGGTNHLLERARVDGRIWHAHCFDSWLRRRRGAGVQGVLL